MELKAGDKVRFKNSNSGEVYTVYAVYGKDKVSLGLADYPDVEGDWQENVDDLELVEEKKCEHEWGEDSTCKKCGVYKQIYDCEYHIFSNGVDEYVLGEDVIKVLQILEKMIVEDEITDIRVYKSEDWDEDEGIFTGEYCVFAMGQFPQ